VQQHSVDEQSIVKNYGYLHDNGIKSSALSWDNNYLFTADHTGVIKCVCLTKKESVHEFKNLHDQEITLIRTSPRYLFSADKGGNLKMTSIKSFELVKEFKFEDSLESICVIPDGTT